jgi:acyl-coenzyme A synthetase/AMP-(fatty) acid ligase
VLLGLNNALGIGAPHVVIERDDPALDGETEVVIGPLVKRYVTSFEVHYVNSLPRVGTGKVNRILLQQTLEKAVTPLA